MIKLNPYLNFKNKTEEAFNFYKSVFGGEFGFIQRFSDTAEAGNVAENEKNLIMHVSLPIGDQMLMGSDVPDSMGQPMNTGNNINLSISTDSKEEADRIFNGLSAGGVTIMPMADTFWGAYFGMAIDKFGIQWMVSYDKPQN